MALTIAVVLAAAGVTGCGLIAGHTSCSADVAPARDPVQVVRSRSFGFAFVTATVSETTGSTRVYDPKYRADVHPVTIDEVLVNRTGQDAAAIDTVVNVHYPDPSPGCGAPNPVADLPSGTTKAFLLGPPSPGNDDWSIDGVLAAFDLDTTDGRPTAIWQARTIGCDGHLAYDLAELVDALGRPDLAVGPPGTCRSRWIGRASPTSGRQAPLVGRQSSTPVSAFSAPRRRRSLTA